MRLVLVEEEITKVLSRYLTDEKDLSVNNIRLLCDENGRKIELIADIALDD